MRNALIRIRAKTLMYHCLVKTLNVKEIISQLISLMYVLYFVKMFLTKEYVYAVLHKNVLDKRRIQAK